MADDLACVGAYLYRMLTGKGADERGETERALEMRAGERWQAVSLGTRQIVLRALRPHMARRFGSASEFRAAVLAQQGLWGADWIDLFGEVRVWLNDLASDKEQAEGIMAKLEMAARLGAPPRHVTHYQAQLKPHVGEV